MFKIDYDYWAATQYADIMLDRVDREIQAVLSPGFVLQHKFRNGASVNVIVDPNGFTKQFLDDFRKSTDLRYLLQGDVAYLKRVVDRVLANSGEHINRLTIEKYQRCYSGRLYFDDFNTILHYIFVKQGYEVSGFVDGEKIVNRIGLKVCPYCGQSYIGSVKYPRGNGKMHIARAQIDHFFPKGQYPFLALSYANFIPSCATCNQSHKHIENVVDTHGRMRMMSPYNFDPSKFRFQFGLKVNGWFSDDNIEVKTVFDVKTPADQSLRDGYHQILGIDKLYEYHSDIVLDVIIKKAIELTAQKFYYTKGIHIDSAYLDRFISAIYGYEPDPKNDRNRIMSKFIRDIVEQVASMTKKLSVSVPVIE